MNKYYEQDGIVIYHGRAEDVLPTITAGGVDLVFTSPPYNLGAEPWKHLGHWRPGDGGSGSKSKWRNGSDACGGVGYAGHVDAIPWAEYVAWQHRVLRLCWDCLNDRGAIFYNHKPRVIGGKLWLPLELNPGLPIRQVVIWARSGGMNFNPTAYVPTHEWIVILAKPDFRLKSKGASGVGDVWYVPQESNPLHPAPFPVALPAKAIDTCAPTAVLDPFAGSGTTLLAAKVAGVRAIGIEKSEAYCEIAANRLRQGVLFGAAS